MRRVGVILDGLRAIDASYQFLNENVVFRQFIVAMRGMRTEPRLASAWTCASVSLTDLRRYNGFQSVAK